MPITITIEANDANEARQLVQDLASTIGAVRPEDFPADTKVSTLQPAPAAATAAASTAQAATPAPTQPAQPPAMSAAPTAAPSTPAPVATPAAAPVTTAAAPAAPTAAPQYDFNQLATATMQLQQAGQNIYEIWAPFGIQALNQLPKERYAEYAAALRQRGAKI